MSKVRGPLLSMSARGQIAKSMVFSSWRGIQYVRQLVTPANPRTVEQTKTRDVFRFLNALYRALGPGAQQPWELYTIGRPMIGRNGFVKTNLSPNRTANDLTALVMSPGARGGPALASMTAVPGGGPGEIDWTIVPGILPDGWAVTSVYAVALLQQDPHGPLSGAVVEQSKANPGPYLDTMVVPESGNPYVVYGFALYTKPDASIAASPSLSADTNSG